MDLKRLQELGGVSGPAPAATVTEVLTESNTEASEQTNRLRKMAGLPPITEAVHKCDEDGCECGGKPCGCDCGCGCKNCAPEMKQ